MNPACLSNSTFTISTTIPSKLVLDRIKDHIFYEFIVSKNSRISEIPKNPPSHTNN